MYVSLIKDNFDGLSFNNPCIYLSYEISRKHLLEQSFSFSCSFSIHMLIYSIGWKCSSRVSYTERERERESSTLTSKLLLDVLEGYGGSSPPFRLLAKHDNFPIGLCTYLASMICAQPPWKGSSWEQSINSEHGKLLLSTQHLASPATKIDSLPPRKLATPSLEANPLSLLLFEGLNSLPKFRLSPPSCSDIEDNSRVCL
jgi:hypothetical protein